MSRYDWIVLLKEVVGDVVDKRGLVSFLHRAKTLIQLETPQEYALKTNAIRLSYDEVLAAVEAVAQDTLSWDLVLDTIVSIRSLKPELEPTKPTMRLKGAKPSFPTEQCRSAKTSPTPQVKKVQSRVQVQERSSVRKITSRKGSPSRLERSDSIGQLDAHTRDLSFQPGPFESLNCFSEGLLYLSLAGVNLTSVDFAFPRSLLVLNLSSNLLTSASLSLASLRLLNLSSNRLQKSSGLHRCVCLSELWASHNRLTTASSLCRLTSLKLLDLSNNSIESLEDIAALTMSTKLNVASFAGNPLASRPNYVDSIRSLLYKIATIDPLDLKTHSEFGFLGSLPYTNAESKPKILARASLNARNQGLIGAKRLSSPPVKRQPSPSQRRSPGNSPGHSRPTSVLSESLYPAISSSKARILRDTRTENSTATSPVSTDRFADLFRSSALSKSEVFSQEFSKKESDFACYTDHHPSQPSDATESAARGASSPSRSIIITQEAINRAKDSNYHNPITALMIKPVGQKRKATIRKESISQPITPKRSPRTAYIQL